MKTFIHNDISKLGSANYKNIFIIKIAVRTLKKILF